MYVNPDRSVVWYARDRLLIGVKLQARSTAKAMHGKSSTAPASSLRTGARSHRSAPSYSTTSRPSSKLSSPRSNIVQYHSTILRQATSHQHTSASLSTNGRSSWVGQWDGKACISRISVDIAEDFGDEDFWWCIVRRATGKLATSCAGGIENKNVLADH